MDHLWSPWRLEYVTGSKPDPGCVFCLGADQPSPSSPSLIVFERSTCYVLLNLYPYNNGHLLIVPYRHTPSLASLTPEELHEMADLMQLSELALLEAYEPHGVNVGVNLGKAAGAGVLEHVHMHVVPRWNGDTNFMTVVGNVRVLPEDLGETAKKLRPIFERLSRDDV
jgi:ATP adenylyltransferase